MMSGGKNLNPEFLLNTFSQEAMVLLASKMYDGTTNQAEKKVDIFTRKNTLCYREWSAVSQGSLNINPPQGSLK